MEDLANQLEQESLEEHGKSLAFNIKQPWMMTTRDLVRRILRKEPMR